MTTVTTANTVYDFRSDITRGGDYTFRVRGIARYDGKAGSWSDYSDESTFQIMKRKITARAAGFKISGAGGTATTMETTR